MRKISETDWKQFRQLRPLALERFCRRVFAEVDSLTAEDGRSSHERYVAVFQLVQRRDRELADLFDNPRRSTALLQLTRLRAEELLTEEELARFGPEMRGTVQALLEGRRP